MARPSSVDNDRLIAGLARVFSEFGYEGASLSALSRATGLQRASLYHRFPGGKRQMAEEVLAAAGGWLASHVFAPLAAPRAPRERLDEVAANLAAFYEGGQRACLLNMLSSPRIHEGPFAPAIRAALGAMAGAFGRFAAEAGFPPAEAQRRGERALMLLQGSLVLSRGLGSTGPFAAFLDGLRSELLPEEARA